MGKASWFICFIFAFACNNAQAQDKVQDLKKEDSVPAASATNKSEQSGAQEPASKIAGTDGNPAVFANGVLTAPGAPVDVDTAPAKFSSRTAADDQLPTAGYRLRHLTPVQKSRIYGELGNRRTGGPPINAQPSVVVGAQIPLELALGGLQPLPESVISQFPELKGLAFASLHDRLALVDPTMRVIIDVSVQ